jgi:uncharacterized membrane protein YphA (DoxX/SURF4 family)
MMKRGSDHVPEVDPDRSVATFGLRLAIAVVWLGNGLGAKVLGLVPRHEEIVSRILGTAHAPMLTTAIGFGEILIGLWCLSGRRPKLCALTQVVLVLTMNIIEQILAVDLLLWGRLNLVFALGFAGIVYWQAFRGRVTKAG